MKELLADKLYSRLPIFCQNLVCTAKGVQINLERYNWYFRNYLSWLRSLHLRLQTLFRSWDDIVTGVIAELEDLATSSRGSRR